VTGVYSTEENAQIAAKDDGEITEYEVDSAISEFKSGYARLYVDMDKEGNVLKVQNFGYSSILEPQYRVTWYTGRETNPSTVYFEGILWARSEAQAIKATNEARAEAIAAGEWEEKEVEYREWDARRIESYRKYYGDGPESDFTKLSGFTGWRAPVEPSGYSGFSGYDPEESPFNKDTEEPK
jgi:hypothetical protein